MNISVSEEFERKIISCMKYIAVFYLKRCKI